MKRGRYEGDPRGGHIRLYHSLIDSPAWNSLTPADQRAYVALRRALGKGNNGDLSLPLSRAKHYGIRSPATLAKALRSLAAVGFVAVTRRGGCKHGGQRLATLYRMTDEAVNAMPAKLIEACKPTDDWRNITSIAHGRATIRKAEEAAKAEAKKKAPLQVLNVTATDGEPVKPKTASDLEAWRPPPVQKVKHAAKPRQARKPSSDSDLLRHDPINPSAPPCFKN